MSSNVVLLLSPTSLVTRSAAHLEIPAMLDVFGPNISTARDHHVLN